MLGINKDKIPGLTQKVIEEKFTLAYQRCQTPSEKDFVVSAAEYLLEYIKSPFAADVTRAKKYHLLQQMREDLDKENKSWHNQIFETLVYGASGYVTAVMTITGIAIIGFYFYNKAGSTFSGDANNITAESFGCSVDTPCEGIQMSSCRSCTRPLLQVRPGVVPFAQKKFCSDSFLVTQKIRVDRGW